MLDFQKVDIDTKKVFDNFFDCKISQNAGSSFTNLFAYDFIYPAEIAQIDDTILSRIRLQENHISYYEPQNRSILAYLPEIEELNKKEKNILSFILEYKESVEFFKKEGFVVEYTDTLSEYVYSREKLETLSGRKLQPKRNHINKFLSLYPSWEYVEINGQDKQDCLMLTDIWLEQELNLSPQFKQDYATERRVIETLFDNFKDLGLYGGAIKVNGQIVAYSLGSFIRKDTFNTNIEKANRKFEGVYTIINRETAKHLPQQIKYINREEDKGIMGLRKAKQSYYPIKMIDKYVAYKEDNHHQCNTDMERVF